MDDKITINGAEYRLGYNLRARMIYEQLIGKPIGVEMLTFENVVFFYSSLLAFNKETFKWELDKFVEYLTEYEEVYGELLRWAIGYWDRMSLLHGEEVGKEPDKKKE